jgi:glycosyltransferase involved in cell wall biosynthesis
MQATDGFVLASRWEGLPMGILEASACALPVVATDVPGTREVIVQGQSGWLSPVDDAAALSAAMTQMMQTSQEKRIAMGERARQLVIAQFSLETVLDQWEALYKGLLNQNSRPTRRSAPSQ